MTCITSRIAYEGYDYLSSSFYGLLDVDWFPSEDHVARFTSNQAKKKNATWYMVGKIMLDMAIDSYLYSYLVDHLRKAL